jgi:N-methylhydantoinase A
MCTVANHTRLAIDIGGTFTDAVLEHGGAHTGAKVLTTPSDPADGFMAAAEAVLDAAGVAPSRVSLVLHGTTLATNAIIERKGAKTALICTEGHRDSLEIAWENRFAQYDLSMERRPPLAPRDLRLPVTERLDFRGEVLTALDEGSVAALIPVLRDARVESAAIVSGASRRSSRKRSPRSRSPSPPRFAPRSANTSASRPPAPTPMCGR